MGWPGEMPEPTHPSRDTATSKRRSNVAIPATPPTSMLRRSALRSIERRKMYARSVTIDPVRRTAPAVAIAVALLLLGASDGGYGPRAWGWASLGGLWICLLALLGRRRIVLTRPAAGMLVGLAALTTWVALSALWSPSVTETALEAERMVAYLAGVGALVLVVESEVAVIAGVALGIAALTLYGLAEYFFLPPALDATQGFLFFQPVGYANAFGGLLAMGIPLLLFGSTLERQLVRAASAALLVTEAVGLYLTQSRVAVLAALVGILFLLSGLSATARSPMRPLVAAAAATFVVA